MLDVSLILPRCTVVRIPVRTDLVRTTFGKKKGIMVFVLISQTIVSLTKFIERNINTYNI